MNFEGLEAFYEALAQAIDRAGPNQRDLFLTRLALLLANEIEDPQKALAAIDAGLNNLQDRHGNDPAVDLAGKLGA